MKKLIITLAVILALLATPVFADDVDLVYIEIRPDLDETSIAANAAPTLVQFPAGGIFFGYSLPIWDTGGNATEELCYQILVPERYDGEHDIIVQVTTALSGAGENATAAYQLDLSWEKVTPDEEAVPAAFHSVSALRPDLSGTQYYCYRDWYVVDYDAPADDPVTDGDIMALRFKRSTVVQYKYTDLANELIVMHVAVLFPRGDLLGDPPDFGTYITEEDMEEIGIQFEAFNGVLAGWSAYFLIGLSLLFLIGLSFLAFWKYHVVLFMLLAAASIILGFCWYDTFTTNLGLAVSLVLIAYSLASIGFAFACIFRRERRTGE